MLMLAYSTPNGLSGTVVWMATKGSQANIGQNNSALRDLNISLLMKIICSRLMERALAA